MSDLNRLHDPAMLVSFGSKLATSPRFKQLFQDGMTLVEEVANYLDGPGREVAKSLPRSLALAYAAESMRLTTRLMQIASWLLVQKAINEGDVQGAKGMMDGNRVEVTSRGIASTATLFAQLPDELQDLTARSMQVQARIIHFDRFLQTPWSVEPAPTPAVHVQFALLHEIFGTADEPSHRYG